MSRADVEAWNDRLHDKGGDRHNWVSVFLNCTQGQLGWDQLPDAPWRRMTTVADRVDTIERLLAR